MVAIQNGLYVTQPADISVKGKRRVNVDRLYNPNVYRPKMNNLVGEPMLMRL